MKGKFYGVSVGPGDPEYMTLKAVRVIGGCSVIAVPRTGGEKTKALEIAREAVDMSGKELLYLDFLMSRDKKKITECYDMLAALVAQKLEAGLDVAMLNLGDASLYASHSYIQQRLAALGYETETVSGVTSFCACAARLGTSLTAARQPLRILPGDYAGLEDELKMPGTKVIMKSGRELPRVIQALKNSGSYSLAKLVTNCGMEDETVWQSLEEAEAGYFSTILVGEGDQDKGDQDKGDWHK